MEPNSIWNFSLTKIYPSGIYLNKLFEINNLELDRETPVSYFFCIESFGDKRCSVTRNEDEAYFSGVYSPSSLQYEIKHGVEYLCVPDESERIVDFKRTQSDDEFEDEELVLNYYPNRQERFNVNFDEINFGRGKKKPFTIGKDMFDSIETDYIIEKVLTTVNALQSISGDEKIMPEDLPYINQSSNNTSNNTTDDEDLNAPYGESEHH